MLKFPSWTLEGLTWGGKGEIEIYACVYVYVYVYPKGARRIEFVQVIVEGRIEGPYVLSQ